MALYYYGTQQVTEEEAELRFLLAQLHRNSTWLAFQRRVSAEEDLLAEFEQGIAAQKSRIRDLAVLEKLSVEQRNRVSRWHDMYLTKADFETLVPICANLRADHQYLSNLVHPLPFAIERVDNTKGRGIGTDAEVGHSLICVMIARRFLAASVVDFVGLVADALPAPCSKAADSVRELVNHGFADSQSAQNDA
ncbi:hypothetical protein [Candidatus Thiosymbion oneisti]|uniref:hypothetical protein n=1 Tax=Candidatus Thiosymbion oneisti TaxID=589554 RepID=UPI00114CE2C4|nr:hypothetical protein [Candidatus Thiosymbion oneisti]